MSTSNIVSHTPGPWKFQRSVRIEKDYGVFDSSDALIAEAYEIVDKKNGKYVRGPSEANARLIAAAPELLEALLKIAHLDIGDSVVMRRVAKDALAKAGAK